MLMHNKWIGFNLRREANPLATVKAEKAQAQGYPFQSQARSQSPGDVVVLLELLGNCECFNLRREANPLATRSQIGMRVMICKFQSQARSQSPGDYCRLPQWIIDW